MSAGDNIRELRRLEHLTQAQLASMLDVSKETVCRWECGKTLMRSAHIKKISELFHVTSDDILSETMGLATRRVFRENTGSAMHDELATSCTPGPLAPIPVYRCKQSPSGVGLQVFSSALAPPDVAERHPHAIFFQYQDRAMSRLYPPESLLLIDPDLHPWNGCSVMALVEPTGIVIRRYSCGNSSVILSSCSLNDAAADLVLDKRQARIMGVIVWFQASHDILGC